MKKILNYVSVAAAVAVAVTVAVVMEAWKKCIVFCFI